MKKLILAGDINLKGFADCTAPFRHLAAEFGTADYVFTNLECCLFDPPLDEEGKPTQKGYFVAPEVGAQALRQGAIRGVGLANNVNLGREPILASIARLDALGIGHTGAGRNAAAARAALVWECEGVRVGFLQRTSVYWAHNHEAKEDAAGVAVVRGCTAYQVPDHRTQPGMTLFNRPGLPPKVVTWVDPPYLQMLQDDVRALRQQCDLVVMSCHWGWHEEVLDYMPQCAHAAVDAGADLVLGHGPHYVLPIEIYRGAPIFYGLGSLVFRVKGDGDDYGEWVGAVARIGLERSSIKRASVQFVRQNERGETVWCALADETAASRDLIDRSATYGTRLESRGDEVEISLT